MLHGFLSAIAVLTSSPHVLGFVALGSLIGLVFGLLPGLGGITAMAILLPLTYGWDATVAMFFFAGVLGAVPFGGSISAILLNTPGTAENAASCFDGHPMVRRGEAKKALGISATASALGGILGILLLVLLVPVLQKIVLAFGPPEFFFLCLFGLVAVAFAAKGSLMKGLVSGGLGVFISLIGYSSVFGSLRFTLGSEYLWDGIKLVPFLVGLLAISELINFWVKGGTIAETGSCEENVSSVWDGMKFVLNKRLCFFRSSAIGTLVGMIPGVGAAVANFLSYTTAVQTSSHPETFGKGEPEGLLASEASNNACISGAFLPTIVFGIPGSGAMAVVLGIFVLHGLEPGPRFLHDHMDVLFAIVLGIVMGNLFAAAIGLATAKYLAKISTVDITYIVPTVLILCFAGTFAYRENIWDVALAMAAGVLGYILKRAGYPIISLVIGYILGALAEKALQQSLMISGGTYMILFDRPLSLVLQGLIIFTLVFPWIQSKRKRMEGKVYGN